jgi:PPOX class probable F420-dependent enzyme
MVRGMADLDDVRSLLAREQGLCVVTTSRADGTMQSTVVNAGVMAHPVDGEPTVALVARASARKVAHLRTRPQITVAVRSGWEWVSVEGTAEIIGLDDPSPHFDADGIRMLLRQVFQAAGGTHDDWDEYDRVMHDERRTAVFVRPTRIYSNG